MTNKVKEHTRFHYLLTEIRLLELNLFHKKYQRESKTKPSVTTYLEYKMIFYCMWILLYCFKRIYVCKKNFFRLCQFISPKDQKKNDIIIYKCFKDIHGKRKRKP